MDLCLLRRSTSGSVFALHCFTRQVMFWQFSLRVKMSSGKKVSSYLVERAIFIVSLWRELGFMTRLGHC